MQPSSARLLSSRGVLGAGMMVVVVVVAGRRSGSAAARGFTGNNQEMAAYSLSSYSSLSLFFGSIALVGTRLGWSPAKNQNDFIQETQVA